MIKNFKPAIAAAAVSLAMLSQMAVAAEEQFFPLITVWVLMVLQGNRGFRGLSTT
jgi:hypothetical protein